MSNAKPLDLSLPYQVADTSLADFGKKEMQLSEREMPGLMELIRRYGDKKPLKGFKVMGSLHMTIQTAMLIKTLHALGADGIVDFLEATVVSNLELLITGICSINL